MHLRAVLSLSILVAVQGCSEPEPSLTSGDRVWLDGGGYAVEDGRLVESHAEGRIVEVKERMARVQISAAVGRPGLDGQTLNVGTAPYVPVASLEAYATGSAEAAQRNALLAEVSNLLLEDLPRGAWSNVHPDHLAPLVADAERLEMQDLAGALRLVQLLDAVPTESSVEESGGDATPAAFHAWSQQAVSVIADTPGARMALGAANPIVDAIDRDPLNIALDASSTAALQALLHQSLTGYAAVMGPLRVLHSIIEMMQPCGFEPDEVAKIVLAPEVRQGAEQGLERLLALHSNVAALLGDAPVSQEATVREQCRRAVEARLISSRLDAALTDAEIQAAKDELAAFDGLYWIASREVVDPAVLQAAVARRLDALEAQARQRQLARRSAWQQLSLSLDRASRAQRIQWLKSFVGRFPEDSSQTQQARERLAREEQAQAEEERQIQVALDSVRAEMQRFLAEAKAGDFEAAARRLRPKRAQGQYLSSARAGWGVAKDSQSATMPEFLHVHRFQTDDLSPGIETLLEAVIDKGDGQKRKIIFTKQDGRWLIPSWW